MSTLRANTVSNSAGTGSPAITGGELSRARFNLNGTGTIAERQSFNIASYVDNGTGDYTANLTTAFPNANYVFTGLVGNRTSEGGGFDLIGSNGLRGIDLTATGGTPTTSQIRITTKGGAAEDASRALLMFVGDRP
jgi:hypothetical protein